MGQVIAIVGLPASGKTTYAKELMSSDPEHFVLIDDPKNYTRDIENVLKSLPPDTTAIITDPHLCVTRLRETLVERFSRLGFEISWIFFENDPEACKKNYVRRHSREKFADIRWFSSEYQVPSDVIPVPVWKC